MSEWRNRIVGQGTVPAGELMPNPKNWRRHPAMQANALQKGLEQVGWVTDVIVNKTTGRLVDGHLRVALALKAGAETPVPVKFVELTEEEEIAVLVVLDPLSAMATTDEETLLANVRMLDDTDLAGMVADVATMLGVNGKASAPDPGPQIDKAEELREKWGVETGQLWQLGEHRLICGDCTDAAVVARVMGGEKADMIFTDPPYGHSNNDGDLIHNWEAALGKPKTASSAARPIANDKPEDAARLYSAFLRTATELLKPGCCCCCCGGGGGPDPQFARWTIEMDQVIGFKMAVVWDKGGLGMGWHYRRNYEFVLVAEKPGAACHWFGGNSVANVIRDIGKIIPSSEQHPTEKPVELPLLFIQLHSQPGEIVWEPFSGSGSTLIAAEKTGRRCRAIEISPAYCAVAIERWAVMTGGTPEVIA